MRFLSVSIAALATVATTVFADEVKIEVTRAVECERKTQKGDKISVHYRGTLQADGSQFDASYDRGSPLSFVVGKGQVIKGYVTTRVEHNILKNKRTNWILDGTITSLICALAKRELSLSPLSLDTVTETWAPSQLRAP